MIWIPLLIVVGSIAWIDIRTRFVPPTLIVPLLAMILVGWYFGWWPVSWLGGLLAIVGTASIKLPLGDVCGFALCGLLVGPLVAMSALIAAVGGLLAFLLIWGDRVSIVRHPFFPYLGGLVLVWCLAFSG
jgi:hypothetical protein